MQHPEAIPPAPRQRSLLKSTPQSDKRFPQAEQCSRRLEETPLLHVLFVSDHDLVRGPMARALCLRHAADMNLFTARFASAGLSAIHQRKPSQDLVVFLEEQELNATAHTASPLVSTATRPADLILCMTRDIAARTRERIPPTDHGKILVFKEAIGFGGSGHADITPARAITPKALFPVYSQLKAATGRLVRLLANGRPTPADFGATGPRGTDQMSDPATRAFLARVVIDVLERAFEPMTTHSVHAIMARMGKPVTTADIEMLLQDDLRDLVTRDIELGTWTRNKKPRAQHTNNTATPPTDEKLTIEAAFAILSLPRDASPATAAKSYRRLLARYHPDKFHDDEEFRALAELKARRLNAAWEMVKKVLGD